MTAWKKRIESFFGGAATHPLHASSTISTSRDVNSGILNPKPDYGPQPDPVTLPTPITRKVLMITHDPVLHTQGGKTLKQYFNWYDSDELAAAYIDDVHWASYGYIKYNIVERIVVDGYPVKRDGFRYDERSYLDAWRTRKFHDPDGVDYLALVAEFEMIEKINSGAIDEVWLFGHPYGGYYESIMAGPGAFWCNAPPLTGTEHAERRFVIMGFNFERGVGEMLEDLGHRAESMLHKIYDGIHGDTNLWERFTRYDKTHPGNAECGNVHFAPNSDRDYDWGNRRRVPSRCDTWYRFPDLSGEPRMVDASEWGDGHIRLHHLWWLRHIPHVTGKSDGISHNWWQYIIDPNTIKPI
ncbi:MAG: hypothetical protein D6737_06485 [Chloroflexi bacterium]|nr:MAG: hypothetical protein D6737_06485 [Chloroflexota bacterium]